MENNEGSESSDNSKEIIEEEEDEYDSDRPNLIHLNTRMERIRRENTNNKVLRRNIYGQGEW